MKILITGAKGQVAYDLVRLAQQKHYHVQAFGRDQLDITDESAVKHIIETACPDIVINTAAYTKVDQAEKEPLLAYAVNRDGARNVARACAAIDRPLIHLSTDYVFNGEQTHPYKESDLTAPINLYGDSKLQGEEEVRRYSSRHIILRVSAVFGVQGVNFVKTMLLLAREKKELRIVADQIICPTPASAIAETLLKLMTFSHWGTYHYCGDEAVSWYEFAKLIIPKCIIHPIKSVDYPTLARRPRYSVLNCSKLAMLANISPCDWKKGLADVLTTL